MDVDWIVSEWAAQFPNINTIVEVLCAMKEEFPKGCTTEELCTFDQVFVNSWHTCIFDV